MSEINYMNQCNYNIAVSIDKFSSKREFKTLVIRKLCKLQDNNKVYQKPSREFNREKETFSENPTEIHEVECTLSKNPTRGVSGGTEQRREIIGLHTFGWRKIEEE